MFARPVVVNTPSRTRPGRAPTCRAPTGRARSALQDSPPTLVLGLVDLAAGVALSEQLQRVGRRRALVAASTIGADQPADREHDRGDHEPPEEDQDQDPEDPADRQAAAVVDAHLVLPYPGCATTRIRISVMSSIA